MSSSVNNHYFFSIESFVVGNLKPRALLQHSSTAVVVIKLGPRVVAARFVVTLVADRRKSFTGTTMVNFWLFAHLVIQLLFILQFILNFFLFKFVHEFVSKLLIMQSKPNEYSDFETLVLAILFYFHLYLRCLICK